MTLEDAIAASAAMGALGVETVGEQMMPGFPDLPDAFYAQWHEWMDRYGTRPTAHDMFLDTRRHRGRLLTRDEMVASVRRDIDHAAKLGCDVIRVIVNTPPEVVDACVPYAADQQVKLAFEVHPPWHFDHELIQRHLEVYERHGPEWVGFMPDLGIFTRRFPRRQAERLIRDGATESIVEYVVEAYNSAAGGAGQPSDLRWLRDDVDRMGGNEHDQQAAAAAAWLTWTDPRRMRELMPYIHHVHAKFFEMTEDGTEYSIPYEEIVPLLVEGGFTGCFSSEYEGQRYVDDISGGDEVEQVRRHQELLARLLDEATAPRRDACSTST